MCVEHGRVRMVGSCDDVDEEVENDDNADGADDADGDKDDDDDDDDARKIVRWRMDWSWVSEWSEYNFICFIDTGCFGVFVVFCSRGYKVLVFVCFCVQVSGVSGVEFCICQMRETRKKTVIVLDVMMVGGEDS